VLQHGASSWSSPSAAYGAFIYPLGGEPLWLPGAFQGLAQDADGKLVVEVSALADSEVSFGGDVLTPGAGQAAYARYSLDLVHEASFLAPGSLRGELVTGRQNVTVLDTHGQLFQEFADDGSMLSGGGGMLPPFSATIPKQSRGRIATVGLANTPFVYEGRDLGAGHMLLTFDSEFALERVAQFFPAYGSSSGRGAVGDYVFADDGASVVIAAFFQEGIAVANERLSFPAKAGLALLKLRLDP
jgi:hypothetical protein